MNERTVDTVELTAIDSRVRDVKSRNVWRIGTIAGNAFREAVRDRVLYNLVLFVLLLTAGAIFLGELSAGQEAKIIVDLGLSSILLFGVFIAIFVGVSLAKDFLRNPRVGQLGIARERRRAELNRTFRNPDELRLERHVLHPPAPESARVYRSRDPSSRRPGYARRAVLRPARRRSERH